MTERIWNLLFNGFLGLFISLVLLCAVVECGRKMNIGITGWLIGFFALIFVVFYTVGLVAVFIEGGKQSPEDDSGKTRQESLRYFAPSIDFQQVFYEQELDEGGFTGREESNEEFSDYCFFDFAVDGRC